MKAHRPIGVGADELAYQRVAAGAHLRGRALLGNAAAQHPAAETLLVLANWIAGQTGARVGYLTEGSAGAIAAVHQAGYDPRPAIPALEKFLGVGRRWQVWGERQGALIVDDYAHHPTEVAAILEAARGTGRRVRAVLQPHRWIRTARQWPELAAAASAADEVLVLDIYAAGESPIPNVSPALIVNRLKEQGVEARAANLESATDYLEGSLAQNDLVITLGAGDVWRVAAALAGVGQDGVQAGGGDGQG